jgi:hypothetical protein
VAGSSTLDGADLGADARIEEEVVMRRCGFVLAAVGLLIAGAACGSDEESSATTAAEVTTEFHAIPADSVVVTGTATCVFSQDGTDPTGGDNNDLATCELDMSDPRVSGTETHDRIRYFEDDAGSWVWVVEEAIITNDEGTWRGTAQAADDGTPIGEARYIGEGTYDGLVFHYYFSAPGIDVAEVRGWISSDE